MENLVSTQWLADNLGQSDLAIIDASAHLPDAGRDPAAEFAAEHIPGARFLNLANFTDPSSPVPAAVPTASQFANRMALLGVTPDSQVVLYDDSYVKTAARAWFILRLHGHRNVAVLDGGLSKWRAEGRALDSGEASIAPASYTAAPGTGTVLTKADMFANLAARARQVVDARGARRFTGEDGDFRPEVASGHIPGSRNVPFDLLFAADGTYKSPADIRAVFEAAGIDWAAPVATTCGGGVTAAALLFAMHLAGKDDTALYDGSWADWGSDPATPKELGEAV